MMICTFGITSRTSFDLVRERCDVVGELVQIEERLATLELAFDSKSLRTICESEQEARLELGSTVGAILKHRLADLRAASSPKDLLVGRPRVLDGEGGRQMTLDLCDGYSLVFTANHTNNPVTEVPVISRAGVIKLFDFATKTPFRGERQLVPLFRMKYRKDNSGLHERVIIEGMRGVHYEDPLAKKLRSSNFHPRRLRVCSYPVLISKVINDYKNDYRRFRQTFEIARI